MPWNLPSFLAHRKAPSSASLAVAPAAWQAEETERLASGPERAQLLSGPDEAR